ncbi:MAG: glutamine--tRNA ligase/YqeY domain fusion protein [Acidobacteria bacterium]|nr:glutamine--tRNA ligase/YqeY domain fusion protein [Acidobacteriota bacterium]
MSASRDGDNVATDFVRTIVRGDIDSGAHETVVTRFPPEPNGFLHIGHAKAICLNFGIAEEFGGRCNLRFDDTNPETEDPRYVAAIKEDIRWLGFDWEGDARHASDYFDQLHDWALELIRAGKAYVDDQTEDAIREQRGTVTEPGENSPHRDRAVEENLELFQKMRAGGFPDGAMVLRAKIDMAHPNMKMRDPLMYRIRHAPHYRRDHDWCIYPFYDWAHGQSDAIEGVTHSLCTLEFENNRELYDWYVDNIELAGSRPRQYEFARLNVDYMITSKRKLLRLVEGGQVTGWDDPRMPTIAGLRRRGVTPTALRRFCDLVGVAKADSRVDLSMLDYAVRDDLNHKAPRMLAVIDPLRVVITNWPEGEVDHLDAEYWPHDVPKDGSRKVPFDGTLLIERDDFMEEPDKGFFRLSPGSEVRLRYGYVIRCDEVVKDDEGEAKELRCSYDPDSRGGSPADGRRIKGTIHWISAAHAVPVETRLYDRLFRVPHPGLDHDYLEDLNPDSLTQVNAFAEPAIAEVEPGSHVQFERVGYFFADPNDSALGAPVFNRVTTLRDTWTRTREEQSAPAEPEPAPSATAGEDVRKRKKRSPVELRAEARAADEALSASFERLQTALGIEEATADVLTGTRELVEFFDGAVVAAESAPPTEVAKWTVNQVLRVIGDDGVAGLAFDAAALGRLVSMTHGGDISGEAAKKTFAILASSGGDPAAIVAEHGLDVEADMDAVDAAIDAAIAANPDKAEQFRGGQQGLIGFFMGQVMREAAGADPRQVQERLRAKLS